MHETVLTIDDAARTLPDVVERVHSLRESALLTKSGLPVARIVPVESRERSAEDLITFLRRWRTENPTPDEDFAVAVESSRSARSRSNRPRSNATRIEGSSIKPMDRAPVKYC